MIFNFKPARITNYATAAHSHIGYADAIHNHDGVYSLSGHNHSGVYATASHNHTGVYAAASHSHSYIPMSGASTKTSGTLTFNDNVALGFGSSNDAVITHDGANFSTYLYTGNWYIKDNSTTRFQFIRSTGVLIAADFQPSSDERLKTEIRKKEIASIDGLKAISYKINGVFKYGFSAQEMLETHPELVTGTGEKNGKGEIDYYRIKESSIIALLVDEVQQLKKEINRKKRFSFCGFLSKLFLSKKIINNASI